MALRSTVVDMPFVGALQEGAEPQHIGVRGFTKVTNGRFDKDGRISKRPGITYRAGGLGYPHALARYKDQLLALDRGLGAYTYLESAAQLSNADQLPPATVERRGVHHDMSEQVQDADMAVAGGWAVRIWYEVGNKLNYLDAYEVSTGAVGGSGDLGSTQSKAARMATALDASGDAGDYMIEVHQFDATEEIWATVIDCSGGVPNFGTTTQLKSVNASLRDITGLPSNRWALTWQNTSTGNLTVSEVTLSGTTPVIGNEFTVSSATPSTGSATAKYIGGTDLIVVWSDATPTTDFDIVDSTSFTSSLGTTTITAAATGAISCTPPSLSGYAMVTFTGLGGLSWVDVDTSGNVGTIQTTYRIGPTSKCFTVNGLVYQWCLWGPAKTESSHVLVQLAFAQSVEARPITTAVFGAAVNKTVTYISNVAEVTPNGEYRHLCYRKLFAADFNWYGVDELIVRFDEPNMWESREFGQATYLAGGILTEWTGSKAVEHNFCMLPEVSASVNTGTFNLSAGDYLYAIVYERIDENGEITRSRPVFTDTISPTANQGANLSVWDDVLTTYQEGTSSRPHGSKVVYRNLVNGKRWYYVTQRDNDHTASAADTFSEGGADGITIDNPVIYTDGGILENDFLWGGCVALCVHKNRLWALSSEDRTKIYYSQTQIDQEPAEMNLGQYVQVPTRAAQIESLDDALIAFTAEPNGKIYAFFGEGPTPNAQGSSLTEAILISGDCGVRDPRSVISTPVGIFFRSDKGFTLLDRSRSVHYVGAPVEDSLESYPDVLWSVMYPAENQVRFGCSDAAGTSTIVLVYDWTQQKWSRWEYAPSGTPLRFVDCKPLSSGNIAYLTDGGDLYEEVPGQHYDYSEVKTAIPLIVETGWINFDQLQGFKRLQRVSLLGNYVSPHGLQLRIAYDYGSTYATTLSFTQAQVSAFAREQARFHLPSGRQKGEAWRFEVRDVQSSGLGQNPAEGCSFTGLSFQVGYLGGLHRQPAAESK